MTRLWQAWVSSQRKCICALSVSSLYTVVLCYFVLRGVTYHRGGSPCIIYTHVVVINKCTRLCLSLVVFLLMINRYKNTYHLSSFNKK